MLCHIGEWHSHHQLRLFQPSQGDSSTVIRNYPGRGTCGFLLIIANIVSPNQPEVTFSPYLYTANSSSRFDQKGTVSCLHYGNAFKKDWRIKRSIEEGRETERDVQSFMTSLTGPYSTSVGTHSLRQSQLPKNSTTSTKVEPMDIDPPAGETQLLLQEGNLRSGEKKKMRESWRK